jgi:magnesium chelatase family protein
MDRIDLRVQVDPVGRVDMARDELGESSSVIRARVIAAREVAKKRFAGMGWSLNSQIPARALRSTFQPERSAMNFLHDELDREHITARGLHKLFGLLKSLPKAHLQCMKNYDVVGMTR